MRLSQIRVKAAEMGVQDCWKYSKRELIMLIQAAEGNPVCFGVFAACDRTACLWHEDCTAV